MKTLTKETRDKLTPDLAISLLKEGNTRFVGNLRAHRNLLEQANETADGQFPFATILSCIDSRTSAELVFDQGLGDIFSIRIAGNVLNEDILGSMEFACKLSGSKLIVVLGHTKCGAIEGACNGVELENLTGLLKKIRAAIGEERSDGDRSAFLAKVTENNVRLVVGEIRRQSKTLSELERQGRIKIVGGIYDIDTGRVGFFQ